MRGARGTELAGEALIAEMAEDRRRANFLVGTNVTGGGSRQGRLIALLKPFPAERMKAYPIGTRVNNVRNDGATPLKPTMAIQKEQTCF